MADIDQLADLFEPVGLVSFKRMFGGYGVHRDGLMFGLFTGEALYLKVDEFNRGDFEREGSEPFRYSRKDGREISVSYWSLPERLWDDPDELRLWSLGALDAARRASLQPKSRRKAQL